MLGYTYRMAGEPDEDESEDWDDGASYYEPDDADESGQELRHDDRWVSFVIYMDVCGTA